MAVQVRAISPTAVLQFWTPTGATGAALLATDDGTYVESSPTSNTASGILALASSFTIPAEATINNVVVRAKVRLATAGVRIVRCGFTATYMAATQNLSSTDWVYMDFPFATDPATLTAWTPSAVNALTTAYLRAYADADGPTVQADYLAIVVDYTDASEPDPPAESIPGVIGIRAGATQVLRVMSGETEIWPGSSATVTMMVTGTSFSPQIELAAGSTAVVEWQSDGATVAGTNLVPSITWATGGSHAVTMSISERADLTTLNFGFNHNDDAGRYNVGAAYDRVAQPVSAITGLKYLTGLKRFLAANGSMAGSLDFTGCSALEYIECFESNVTDINLNGCSSLIRLCIEGNAVSVLDLAPVRTTLRDLRAAVQQEGVLEFLPFAGNLTNLYHFCVRDQELILTPSLAQMPVIEQWWVWNCGIVSPGTPTSTILNSCLAYNNNMSQTAVDTLLVHINNNVVSPSTGNVRLEGNTAPSATGEAAANAIIARGGWSVTTDAGSGGGDPDPPPTEIDGPTITAALNNRWVFAHQSVGMQVIQGIQTLCDMYGLPDPTVIDVETGTIPGSGPYLGHWYVGTNGDGFSKLTDYNTTIRGGLYTQADIFVLKFCYADLRPNVGYTPQQLFDQYKLIMDGLIADFPTKTFILATETIVMEADEDGPNNGLRMTFNNLVRAEYGDSHLWDIALALSTDPDGNRIRTGTAPNYIEHLYSAYASPDMEHISGVDSIGRRAAAAPLLQILATL